MKYEVVKMIPPTERGMSSYVVASFMTQSDAFNYANMKASEALAGVRYSVYAISEAQEFLGVGTIK